MSFYAKYPATGGVPTYPTFADLPATAADGALALTLDTDTLYAYNANSMMWLALGSPSAVLSVGPIDSQAPGVNGATLNIDALIMQSASTGFPGLVNNTTQSFSGNKTLTGTITASNLSGTNTGDVTIGTANGLSIAAGQILSLALSSTSTTGALSSTDWNTFNNKQDTLTLGDLTDAGTDGIIITGGTGAVVGTGTSIAQHVADTTHNGYLSSTDWNTFNSKQAALSITDLTDVGTDGITITNGTGAVIGSSPVTIDQHVADTTHNGYLSSTDWNTFNSKQAAGNYITALTGDVTATGPGSVAATLATVNANVGTFGTATQVSTVTVNAKGLVTAAANTSIQIAEAQVTNLVSDLAGKQPVGNYITALTGDATATGPGSVALTLATVNANIGTFAATTVNAKGLVTAATALTGDATTSGAALTLATVNGNVGSFTNASITVNAKGLVTAASSGTAPVTSISVATANGLAGTSSGGTTPALTLSTTISGILQGDGTAISAATTTGTGNVVLSASPTLTGTITAAALTLSTPLTATSGGTGTGTYTTGDILYASATNTLSKLPIGSSTNVLTVVAGVPAWSAASTGTVTSVSVVSANGLAGTVATATTTPAITLSTTISGILQGNGTAISAASTTGTGNVVLSASPTLTGTIAAAALTLSTPLAIASGGTGQSTKAAAFDALSPMTTGGDLIYGGASGTGTRLANGTAGQVLESAGTTAAPVWTTLTAPTKQILAAGTGATYTTPAGAKLLKVTVIGAGGGGGGSQGTAANSAAGGGGGGGGVAIKWITSPAASYLYTLSATGGTAGTAGNNSGGSGSATTFDNGGSTITGNGGGGGSGGASTTLIALETAQAGGGTGTGGDLNIPGGAGGAGMVWGTTNSLSGQGGASQMGMSTGGAVGTDGTAGQLYGGGGSGGATTNSATAHAGGAGAVGAIIVEEFYQ